MKSALIAFASAVLLLCCKACDGGDRGSSASRQEMDSRVNQEVPSDSDIVGDGGGSKRQQQASPIAPVGRESRAPLEKRTSAVYVMDSMLIRGGTLGLSLESLVSPNAPSPVGQLVLAGTVQGIAPVKAGLIAAGCGAEGVVIVDVSNATSPEKVGWLNTEGGVWRLDRFGQYTLVADGHAGVVIADLRQPEAPRVVGRWSTEGYVRQVKALGENRALVAEGRAGVSLLDLSNPQRPQLLGRCDTQGEARAVDVRAKVVFIADFHDGVVAFDFTDPQNMRELGQIGTLDSARDVLIVGDHLVVAVGYEGVQIIDVSDPTAMREVSRYRAHAPVVRIATIERTEQLVLANDHDGVEILDISERTNLRRVYPNPEE